MVTRAQQARAAKMTPAERSASQILAGDCDDGMHLIVNAMTERVVSGAVSLNWRIDLDDLHVTEEDLTLEEADLLERLLDCTWGEMDPLRSARHAAALIRILLRTRLDLPDEEAADRVKSLTVKATLAALTRYTEQEPPKA